MNKSAHSRAILGACLQMALPAGIMSQKLMMSAWRMEISKPYNVDEIVSTIRRLDETTYGFVWAGLVVSLIGFILFTQAITAQRYRRSWAFWFACVYGSLMTVTFPFVTPFGVFLLVYALIHRKEFLREQPGDQEVAV
jgi:hypothetical protein